MQLLQQNYLLAIDIPVADQTCLNKTKNIISKIWKQL